MEGAPQQEGSKDLNAIAESLLRIAAEGMGGLDHFYDYVDNLERYIAGETDENRVEHFSDWSVEEMQQLLNIINEKRKAE
ncbi:MAG: hypothetical protein JWL92_157 [Candidatus Nomurabacteria bacterium]|nr:hypothetical protein [Candidatus Nomurabacteria bacterium]